MKLETMKQRLASSTVAATLIGSVFLSSCGGDVQQSAGIGGTGIVSGSITGFGSVYVNGNKFDTAQSQFIVDGNIIATQADLSVGMVVRLKVDTENGVYTGIAIDVVYDDLIEGPIAAAPVADASGNKKTFEVFDQTIVVDQTSTIFDGTNFNFENISIMDVVEISGFRISPTEIVATYIRKTGTLVPMVTPIEVKGTISLFDAANMNFMLAGVTVSFDVLTNIDLPGGISLGDGLYVEVKGIYQSAIAVDATEIEFEDDDLGDNVDEVSLQGIITQFTDISDFYISGQQIDASQASLSPGNAASLLANGLNVEVDGDIVNGILVAEELEIREGNAELKSFVSAVDLNNNQFEVSFPPLAGSVVVKIGAQTLFEDEGPLQLENFSLDLLVIGDFVKVEGAELNDIISANIVKRKNAGDTEIQGEVDFYVPGTSITILGIDYLVDPGTSYIPSSTAINIGAIVEIQDNEVADGIADKVEIE